MIGEISSDGEEKKLSPRFKEPYIYVLAKLYFHQLHADEDSEKNI